MPDLVFFVRFGREQDPHAQLAVVFGGTDMVRASGHGGSWFQCPHSAT
jgi:hypothetical protein